MAVARRIGTESSATRAQIIAAAEAIFIEEGYGAASTRRVAARAGLKPSLVHYYFPTTEDLLLAMSRKGQAESDEWLERALAAPDPLTALWQLMVDSSRNALALETMALANHREAIRAEISAHSHRMRARQVEAIERVLGERLRLDPVLTAPGLSLILAGIGRALVMEGGLGITIGHEDAARWVRHWLGQLTGDSDPAPDA
ncbi:MAG: TetR/AcrR family transcriptional regulator [Sphingomonadales bacterium]|nr:TetR/AcrR family transcriptional regulator [Sphingomonadales bacterium]